MGPAARVPAGRMPRNYPLPMPAPHPVPAAPPGRTLIVRLRNWVGDVVLALPMLQRLHAAGYTLQVVGKRWAGDLLAATGWPVHTLPAGTRERIAQLRALRAEALRADPGFARQAVQMLVLPDSFSSALECRLAGLRGLGHAWEARSWLLKQAVPRPRQMHEAQVYWQLGSALLGQAAPPPATVALATSAAQQARARQLLAAQGVQQPPIVICPFAGGTWNGQPKTWPGFAAFAAQVLPQFGRELLICPGPGAEEALARAQFAGARLLPGVDLGTYAALLQQSALMLSNDTGPGHIAAAVGTPLVSVLGPSDPGLWRPLGPQVQVVGGGGHWPDAAAVQQAAAQALAAR